MIARMWTGHVPTGKADAYFEHMREVAAPDYQRCAGNRGCWCLKRDQGAVTEVIMLTFWEDLDLIRAFAGDAVDTAKYYDFDKDYLIDFPEHVKHFVVEGAFPMPAV